MDFESMPRGLGLSFEVEICRFIRPSPWSACREQFSTGLEQVRRCRQDVDLAKVLGKATQADLLRVELLLDHPELVFEFRADISPDWLEQILHLPSGASGRILCLPGRMATLNPVGADGIHHGVFMEGF